MDGAPKKIVTIDDIEPGKTYTVAEVAPLFRRNQDTIRAWARSGELESCDRSHNKGPFLFRGQVILDRLGYKPRPVPEVEKARDRKKRLERADQELQEFFARK